MKAVDRNCECGRAEEKEEGRLNKGESKMRAHNGPDDRFLRT